VQVALHRRADDSDAAVHAFAPHGDPQLVGKDRSDDDDPRVGVETRDGFDVSPPPRITVEILEASNTRS
jgi:hypothetical protein